MHLLLKRMHNVMANWQGMFPFPLKLKSSDAYCMINYIYSFCNELCRYYTALMWLFNDCDLLYLRVLLAQTLTPKKKHF